MSRGRKITIGVVGGLLLLTVIGAAITTDDIPPETATINDTQDAQSPTVNGQTTAPDQPEAAVTTSETPVPAPSQPKQANNSQSSTGRPDQPTQTPPPDSSMVSEPDTEQSIPAVASPEETPSTTASPKTPDTDKLTISPEVDGNYERDDWGDHESNKCNNHNGIDPFTDTEIDKCNVDHIVSLKEAFQSGGRNWTNTQKRMFSQDSANHIATRACVNQSKGAHDIAEWKMVNTTACKGEGYTVTQKGICLFRQTTITIKVKYNLSIDQSEYNKLKSTSASCK